MVLGRARDGRGLPGGVTEPAGGGVSLRQRSVVGRPGPARGFVQSRLPADSDRPRPPRIHHCLRRRDEALGESARPARCRTLRADRSAPRRDPQLQGSRWDRPRPLLGQSDGRGGQRLTAPPGRRSGRGRPANCAAVMSAAARSPNGVRGAGMSRTSTGSIEGAAIFGHAARGSRSAVLAHSETATADRESRDPGDSVSGKSLCRTLNEAMASDGEESFEAGYREVLPRAGSRAYLPLAEPAAGHDVGQAVCNSSGACSAAPSANHPATIGPRRIDGGRGSFPRQLTDGGIS